MRARPPRAGYPPFVSWDDYRVLLAFSRAGSLGKAADALGVDKATVSRRLSALEESLDAELVERLRTGWRLTSHGRSIASAAEAMERAAHDAEAEVRGEGPRGAVRLTAPVWFARAVLLPHLAAFRERHPAVQLEILATNAVLDLGGRDAEIGIRNLVPTQASMVARKLGALGSALYGSPAYLARRGTPSEIDELAAHAFVAYHDAITYCPSLARLSALDPPVAFRASDTVVLLDAVRAGLGLAVVPCRLADPDDSVTRVLPEVLSRDDIFACYPEALRRLPRVRCVVDWVAARWDEERDALAGRAEGGS